MLPFSGGEGNSTCRPVKVTWPGIHFPVKRAASAACHRRFPSCSIHDTPTTQDHPQIRRSLHVAWKPAGCDFGIPKVSVIVFGHFFPRAPAKKTAYPTLTPRLSQWIPREMAVD